MMLVDLADVCRRSGLNVVEDAGWKTRSHGRAGKCYCAVCPNSTSQIDVESIILHHTGGPAFGEAPSLRVVREGRTNLAGPLAHLVLGRSGTVYVIAAGLCWHAGATFEPWQANAHSIGIEAEATGTDAWPAAQYDAYVRLVRALADHYRVPYDRVRGHKEAASPLGRKADPNFSCPAFRAALRTRPPEDDDMPLTDADVDKIADRVWTKLVANGFGDKVTPVQILNGIEKRAADVQATLAETGDTPANPRP